jgi:hypothetical protein
MAHCIRLLLSRLAIGVLFITSLGVGAAGAFAQEVWFAPNDDLPRGPNRDKIQGPDFQHLFDPTPSWKMHIDVFAISSMMATIVAPDDEISRIDAVLSKRHIALAVAIGAALVDSPVRVPGECGYNIEGMQRPGGNAREFKRLKKLGLHIKYIVMDEPLTFAHYYKIVHSKVNACQYSIEETARRVAGAIAEIRQYYPDVRVVQAEAPTVTSAAQWNSDFGIWLNAYRKATGLPLDAVVLDIDWRRPWLDWASPAVTTAHKNGVRAGIFLTGNGPGASDAEAIAAYKHNMQSVDDSHLPLDLVIIANWTAHPSYNLPETSPDTLTSVLNWYNARHGR